MRLAAEELGHPLLHLRDARRTADKNHLVNIRCLQARIRHRLPTGLHRPLDDVIDELLELGPRQRLHKVLRTRRVRRQVGKIDLRLRHRRELNLRLLRGILEPLKDHLVLRDIHAGLPLELLDEPVHQPVVNVVAAERRVAVRRLYLDHAVADLQNGDVEGAAAEVVDRDGLLLLLVETVGQRRGRRLVDDALHIQAGDAARVTGRLALAVVEVGRHRNDRLRHRLAQVGLRSRLQLHQHLGADLRRSVATTTNLKLAVPVLCLADRVGHPLYFVLTLGEFPADEPLGRENRALRVRDRLPLRNLTRNSLAVGVKRHNRGGRPRTLLVRDHDGLIALHHADNRVRRSEVNADDLCHLSSPSIYAAPSLRRRDWLIPTSSRSRSRSRLPILSLLHSHSPPMQRSQTHAPTHTTPFP